MTYSEQQCLALLEELEDQWVRPDAPYSEVCRPVMDAVASLSNMDDYNAFVTNTRDQLTHLHLRLSHLACYGNTETAVAMNRLIQVVGYSLLSTTGIHRARQASTAACGADDVNFTFFQISSMISDSLVERSTPWQQLLMHISSQAQLRNYRRYGDKVYEPLFVDGVHNTHSWRPVCKISEFIYRCCQKETHFEKWQLLTGSPNFHKNATEWFDLCEDKQFPHLVKSRSAFSFSNGIYLTETDSFMPFGEPMTGVPANLCCAKHFDSPVVQPLAEAWRDIRTPNLDTMLESQGLLGEVGDWLYIFLGRLLYEVRQKDNWCARTPSRTCAVS